MDTVPALLSRAVSRSPNAPAVIAGDQTLSYAALERVSIQAAGGLHALGIEPGDRVALWLPNVPAYLVLYLACARIGAISVAVNTRYRAAEVEDIIGRTRARVLAMCPGFREIPFMEILDDVHPHALETLVAIIDCDPDGTSPRGGRPTTKRIAFADLASHRLGDGGDGEDELAVAAPSDGCNIFTTSGTTRAPKFVVHAHRSISVHACEVASSFALTAPDVVTLNALPLCGVFGLCSAVAALAAAKPMVLMPAFDAEQMLALMSHHRVTHFHASDDMVDRLLEASRNDETFERVALVGYATFNSELADIAERADARGLRLVGLWGMSEMQALVACRDPRAPVAERGKPGGALVSPGGQVRMRDPDSGQLLPPNHPGHPPQPGEIEITGPSRMTEYFEDEEASAATLTGDGFVRTGDLGILESDRSFEFLARIGDTLRLGGFLVSPAEIEAQVLAHPGVHRVQVVSAPSRAGNRAVAFVVPSTAPAFDPDEVEAQIQTQCARRLAKYKVPARVVALDEFPVTMSANGVKIQRAKLREMARSLLADG